MTDLPPPPEPTRYRFERDQRHPIEILVFQVAPEHADEFLAVDHEVWTLGEAATPGTAEIPFLSKEVWLNDARPGEITIVFAWPDRASWDHVGRPAFQQQLTDAFEQRFPHPYELVRAVHEEPDQQLHRWSRFERR
jgi:uncharacterized protein (TIGR03792 family)